MDVNVPVMIMPLTGQSLFLLGCFGGFVVAALKQVRKLEGKQAPDRFDLSSSIILILIGGGVAAVFHGQVQSTIIAVQLGASAPAIIGAWASGGPPSRNGGRGPKARGRREPGTGPLKGKYKFDALGIAARVLESLSWRTPEAKDDRAVAIGGPTTA